MSIKSFFSKLFGSKETELEAQNKRHAEVRAAFKDEKFKANPEGWKYYTYYRDSDDTVWYFNGSTNRITVDFKEAEAYPNQYEAYKHYGNRTDPFNPNKIIKIFIMAR